MQGNLKKIGLIVASVILISLCIWTIYNNFFGDVFTSNGSDMWFKCIRPECNAAYSLTPDQFAKIRAENPSAPMMIMPGSMQSFKCEKCGQQTAFMAIKCEKCGEVYIVNVDAQNDYPDRCPKCKYSYMETSHKK